MGQRGGTVNLFVCDDETTVRVALNFIFDGFAPIRIIGEAATAEDSIRQMRKLEPDVVIFDLCMRHQRDGLRICEKVCVLDPAPRLICYSAFFDAMTIRDLLKLGVAGFVDKGEDVSEVREAVQTVARGGRMFSPLLAQAFSHADLFDAAKGASHGIQLSPRQMQTLELLAEGQTAYEVADRLGVTENSVRTHRRRLCEKFSVNKTTELIAAARKSGFIQ